MVKQRRKKVRRLVWVLSGLVAIAGLTWVLLPSPVPVETVAAARGELAATVRAEGKTRVKQLYDVLAPVDGTLQRITVQAGDPVESDTTVARIAPLAVRPLDPRSRGEATAAVTATRAAVSRADAAVQEATAAAEHADSQLETARNLAERDVAPRQDAVHAGHAAEIAHRALDEARAAARQARAELARASAVVGTAGGASDGDAVVVTPLAAGRVLRILRESGGPVAAGTPLLQIGDVTQLEVVADLLSSDAARVKVGAEATITGWGGDTLAAKVRRIDPAAFTKVSALGLEEQRVHVTLDLVGEPPPNLGHDYRVDAHVVFWEGDDVLRVPATALFRRGSDWAVYVVRDGRARLTKVDVGPSDGTWTVIDRGVSAGESIVVQPSDEVRDGVRVEESLAPRNEPERKE